MMLRMMTMMMMMILILVMMMIIIMGSLALLIELRCSTSMATVWRNCNRLWVAVGRLE